MKEVYIGLDVSKGYCDVALLYKDPLQQQKYLKLDDHPVGWNSLKALIKNILKKDKDVQIKVGMEYTGIYHRHWANFLTKEFKGDNVKIYVINPYKIKKYAEMTMVRNKTDRVSARIIAKYLSVTQNLLEYKYHTSAKRFGLLKLLKYYVKKRVEYSEQITDLKQMIYEYNPAIAAKWKTKMPNYIVALIEKYPTAQKLAKAHLNSICNINYMDKTSAKQLKQLSSEIEHLEDVDGMNQFLILDMIDNIKRLKNTMKFLLNKITDYRKKYAPENSFVIETLPGVNDFTAAVLTALIWDSTNFISSKQLIAYIGLNPSNNESGDMKRKSRMSKKGDSFYRSSLFFPILMMVRKNPVLKDFYKSLVSRGKKKMTAIIASMAKFVRIAYALVKYNRSFDPNYRFKFVKVKQSYIEKKEPVIIVQSSLAPISNKEFKKRKKSRAPQNSKKAITYEVARPPV